MVPNGKNKTRMDFKEKLTIISDNLNHSIITEQEARKQICVLLGVINAKRTVCHTCKEDIADYFVPTLDDLRCPECGNKWHTDL